MAGIRGNRYRKFPETHPRFDPSRPWRAGKEGRCHVSPAPPAGLGRRGVGAALLAALVVVAIAAARPPPRQPRPPLTLGREAHKCLVMAGSGDPAFTKNFNPFTGNRPPQRPVRQGRDLRRPDRSRPRAAKPTLPWLARSWKWSNGNKTLTLQPREGRQVVGRQAADLGRRRLQPHRRQAEQGDGHRSASRVPTRTSPRSRRRARTRSSST